MPNPDFTGSVPHRRCETCVHWERFADGVTFGSCSKAAYSLIEEQVTITSINPMPTTDLSVCSSWMGKTSG